MMDLDCLTCREEGAGRVAAAYQALDNVPRHAHVCARHWQALPVSVQVHYRASAESRAFVTGEAEPHVSEEPVLSAGTNEPLEVGRFEGGRIEARTTGAGFGDLVVEDTQSGYPVGRL